MTRGFQIYIKDVRRSIFNKVTVAVVVSSIIGALAVSQMFPFVVEEEGGTEIIISSIFKMIMIYYAVNHFGSDYFTKTARLIFSVQEGRLVIYAFKLMANMTTALYLAAMHIVLKLIVPGIAGELTSFKEVLSILSVYLLFSITVTVFSIALSMIVKSGAAILVADYFLFFWTIGDNLAALGSKLSDGFLRLVFTHNTFYELGHSFSLMKIEPITLKSCIPFILFFGIVGMIMLKKKDIA
jgi:hypothetical protein